MKLFLVLVIIFFNYRMFYLAPWAHQKGSFNTMDLAILMILFWMVYILIFKRKLLLNAYSFMIIFLLFLVGFHIPFAVMNFEISFANAVIASRVFLLYLSYFVFLDIFTNDRAINIFLTWIMILSLFSIFAGLFNYYGYPIIHHDWATEEGARMRGGIVRAYFPAYWMIAFASLYSFTIFLTSKRVKRFPLIFFVISIGTIVFRQTRIVIFSYALVACYSIIKRLSNPRAIFLVIVGFAGMTAVLLNLNEFVFIKTNIEYTQKEISESRGSWGGRAEQLQTAWELIQENPIFGTGSSALRSNPDAYSKMSTFKAKKLLRYSMHSDLGYAVWLKNFGIIGAFFLILLAIVFIKHLRFLRKSVVNLEIISFAYNYFLYVAISFMTLNHLGHSDGILLVTSVLAMVQSSVSRMQHTNSISPGFHTSARVPNCEQKAIHANRRSAG
jgi:O-antigen ligase